MKKVNIISKEDIQITDNHLILYPKGQEITQEDLGTMIQQNSQWAAGYQENYRLYIGDHAILHEQKSSWGPDNKLVVNLPKYICDTFTGFFVGIPPKITLEDKSANDKLQDWNNTNSFQDKLSEISKQTDIYGRSIAFMYQDEEKHTRVTVVKPAEGFIVYDDTVAQHPLAFIRYSKTTQNGLCGTIYYANKVIGFTDGKLDDTDEVNIYGVVPAVEFFENEERQGAFDNVKTLCEALDKALSNKANQNEYYDNAYLKILGLQLPTDENNNVKVDDIKHNHLIYSPDAESANATVDFVGKPDADALQEHFIERLLNLIYQISMVPNLSDKEFASNQSGVAIRYKLLAIQNLASSKERKFTQSLRQLYRVLFSVGEVAKPDEWQNLKFQFSWNIPANLADEAQTAKTLMGVTSHETALKPLSIVDDPKQEIEKIHEEQAETARNALENSPSATDLLKGDDDGE
ncbi:phage portal protein [Limosilactobacillus reuteri]